MVRRGLTAALATFDRATGHPYVSLVLVATTPAGEPLLLLSGLARHTHNLRANSRASLLFDGTSGSADPLAGGRATLIGRVLSRDGAWARDRFLSRHPSASAYADFADFGFHALAVQGAHFIGGFGRIVELTAADVLIATAGAETLLAAEPEIVAHMNQQHAAAVAHYATEVLGEPVDAWRMTGIDPEGADLVAGARTTRLSFAGRAATPQDARRELAHLAGAA